MNSPNYEEVEKQFFLLMECLPISFGYNLPPNLRLRYINLLSEIGDFPKRIKRFQATLSGEKYEKPDWVQRSSAFPKKPSADFRGLDNVFEAMQHSLPYKYIDELPDKYRIPYCKILEQHAHLQLKSSRLEKVLKKKGFL
ncbi:hypothetical protein [Marinobacterium stanieri]|uniref:Uncharacterized protein n=1 Tax=Marinobacterium stanieri TaxID=49186 RepID=A0A1N6VQP8_9GAMM|nr:hypothetical protein [Marinobacterium stanieri]SIQ80139.1 hypothetical protein SAMN05421647_10960 [Marinobacterium stanieri]